MKKLFPLSLALLLSTPLFAPCPDCETKRKPITRGPLTTSRVAQYPIHHLILNRWSPRAMSGEPVSEQELATLFEAARWAPSSYNDQPWHFIFCTQDGTYWNTYFDLLGPFNREWVKNAGALVVILSNNKCPRTKQLNRTHSFDAGAAWQNMALQGAFMGLVVHAMAGFDYEKARKDLNIPEDYTIEAMVAVGKPGDIEQLPEGMREYEKPSPRRPVVESVTRGIFPDTTSEPN